MRNRLVHLSDAEFSRHWEFVARHPGIMSRHHLLQKLAIFDFVSPIVAGVPHETILEIGCGLGVHSALLSQFGKVSATELEVPGSFIGADHDVHTGRNVVLSALARNEVTFSANDGRSLPYPDNAFDVVFHNSVIEHVPNVMVFNREVARVLKPGGACICITGTPALCGFRYVKDYLLKLPFTFAVAVAREMPAVPELAGRALASLGRSPGMVAKARERLQRIDRRLRSIAGTTGSTPTPPSCRGLDIGALHPRLYHYLYFPKYNRIVLEEIAREHGITVEDLLACMERHFRSTLNRLRFSLTPRTHGQHYRNARHEFNEWALERWVEHFKAAGLLVEVLRGFRYHHVLEATPRHAWDAGLYFRATPFLQRATWLQSRPNLASEFILVARKAAPKSERAPGRVDGVPGARLTPAEGSVR
jgi:SAM-dependent methyltransferase